MAVNHKTCFLMGSGPSLKKLYEPTYIQSILCGPGSFSIGLNFSFLFAWNYDFGLKTNYHYLGYEPSSEESIRRIMTPKRRESLSIVKWLLPWRSIFRGYHPWNMGKRSLFPYPPRIKIFQMPGRCRPDYDRPFCAEDFKSGIRYRGVMSLGLALAEKFGATRIVLCGVDLETTTHFFDDMPEMADDVKSYKEKFGDGPFESMTPRDGQWRTMEDYYYAANELYFRPKGIELFTAFENKVLSPRIPIYNWKNSLPYYLDFEV